MVQVRSRYIAVREIVFNVSRRSRVTSSSASDTADGIIFLRALKIPITFPTRIRYVYGRENIRMSLENRHDVGMSSNNKTTNRPPIPQTESAN